MTLVPRRHAFEPQIHVLRGQRVMISTHLAALNGVEPRALIQAVRRNTERFPADFMFRCTLEEANALLRPSRSQTVILKRGENVKHLPYAFTQEGVAMLSSVLRSPQAIRANVEIMRAFVRLRQWTVAHEDLARRLDELEMKCGARACREVLAGELDCWGSRRSR